jgi:hypothetical protein
MNKLKGKVCEICMVEEIGKDKIGMRISKIKFR